MQEINLYDLLKHYAKYWLFILLCTLTGLIAGFVYNNHIQVPMYKSNATLLVLNNQPIDAEYKSTAINNYLELLKSRRVLEPVIDKLNLNKSYEELVGSVTTTNDKDTEVVKLTIATTNPKSSKNIVDATVVSFKKEIKRLYNTDTIQVIDSANLPTTAYNVRKNIQLVLFAAAGFLFSIVTVFFIYDYRLSTGSTAPITTPNVKAPVVALTKPMATKIAAVYARSKAKRSAKKQARTEAKLAKNLAKSVAKEEARAKKIAIAAQKQADADIEAQAQSRPASQNASKAKKSKKSKKSKKARK